MQVIIKTTILTYLAFLIKTQSSLAIEHQCYDFLSQSQVEHVQTRASTETIESLQRLSKLQKQNISPYLGVIIKLDGGGLLLAIGPYFGNKHEDIVKALIRNKKIVIEGFVWGGELLISKKGRSLVVHSANETSGFINDLFTGKSKLRNNTDPWYVSDVQDLNHTFVIQSNVGFLDFFRNSERLLFSPDYQPIRFSLDNSHILPGLVWDNINIRHDFGNEISTVIAWTEMLSRQNTNFNYDLKFIKKILGQLNIYVQSYILSQTSGQKNKETNESLDKFSKVYSKFNLSDNPFATMTTIDWHELSTYTKRAFDAVFNQSERPIEFEVRVSDAD